MHPPAVTAYNLSKAHFIQVPNCTVLAGNFPWADKNFHSLMTFCVYSV